MANLNRFLIQPPVAADLSYLPDKLCERLLPFQKEGISFAISKQGRWVYL